MLSLQRGDDISVCAVWLSTQEVDGPPIPVEYSGSPGRSAGASIHTERRLMTALGDDSSSFDLAGIRVPRLRVVGGSAPLRRGLREILLDDRLHHDDRGPRRRSASSDARADDVAAICVVVHDPGEPVSSAPHPVDDTVFIAAVSGEQLLGALAQGYDGVIDLEGSAATIVLALRAALAGQCMLPTALGRRLSRACTSISDLPPPYEIAWLARLATGSSVLELAESQSLSERVMYRRLAGLYQRLGVGSRAEAIALAARAGLLAPAASLPA